MSVDESVQEQAERDRWLTRWLKSESFWQAIVIQTLGTLGAALIIALVAILSGAGYTPAIRYYVIFGVLVLIYILGFIALVIRVLEFVTKRVGPVEWLWELRYRRAGKPNYSPDPFWRNALSVILVAAPIAVALFIGEILMYAARIYIARWTGYNPKS